MLVSRGQAKFGNAGSFAGIFFLLALVTFLYGSRVFAQQIPDVRCHVEDFPIHNVVTYWQSPEVNKSVQVVVLKDPAGEQEARFDLTHGATLISLRCQGRELMFGQMPGANVGLYIFRHGTEAELKGLNPYWSAFHPDQGGSSMGVPSAVAGVACGGELSMRALAMMTDVGVDNSFQPEPLLAVWAGKVSDNFPPGYSTRLAIETGARWVKNSEGPPSYYLQLDQTVVNVGPSAFESVEWSLEGAVPWDFTYTASYPERCTEKTPCKSADAPAMAIGRYQDQGRNTGLATVVPTSGWDTSRVFTRVNGEYIALCYGPGAWVAPRHVFATVLTRDLQGLKGFHFSWIVCGGSWQQAQATAERIASAKR
jgi:hypothetical protein